MGPKKLQYGLLNIVTHPHSYDTYLSLFREAARKRISVKVTGNERALLDEPFSGEIDGHKFIYGNLHRYSAIDENGKWVNLETLDEPAIEELSKLKDLKNLGPNHRMFPYFFFPKSHKMIVLLRYHNKTISLRAYRLIMETLFKSPDLVDWGPAYVNIVQSNAVLDDIKKLKRIKSVRIKVSLPNSDGAFEDYSSLIKTMDTLNAGSALVEYKAPKHQSLTYTEVLQKDVEDTLMNGGAIIEGVSDDGSDVIINTLDNPLTNTINSKEEIEILKEEVPRHAITRNQEYFRPSIE